MAPGEEHGSVPWAAPPEPIGPDHPDRERLGGAGRDVDAASGGSPEGFPAVPTAVRVLPVVPDRVVASDDEVLGVAVVRKAPRVRPVVERDPVLADVPAGKAADVDGADGRDAGSRGRSFRRLETLA